ncbi:MAG: NCS2 family permease [Caldicoprobacterales bacterium]|jgi:AGZA family xanthine/uracil permease-like MFS transporter|nr:NCS2 family permease [Clostridiales bacterium]
MNGFLDRTFKLREHKTDVKTEIMAGITTFMTMAYILIVNPNILSGIEIGVELMDRGAVFTATALSAAIATIVMAFLANYPVALASGMGLNAFFAFVVATKYSWQIALTAVLIEGIIFIILSFFKFREAIVNGIPENLKYSVTVGIGLFIAFIGLQNAGIITDDGAVLVGLGNLTSITSILFFIGLIGTIYMTHKGIKGALLWGILGTYALGIICQLTGLYTVDIEAGRFNLIPEGGIVSLPPSLAPTFMKFDFQGAFKLGFEFIVILFSFLFVDIFDTVGTLIGVASKGNLLDKEGKLPKAKQALLADAIGTVSGACLGTSTVTSYVESAAGVAEGGRTGLTALVTGLMFLVALIFSPIFTIIPSFATAPILVTVGLFMVTAIAKVDFSDYTEALPAFLTIIMMPMAYSIADGIMFGMLSWVILKLVTGKAKQINPLMYVLALLFILKIIL